MRRKIDSTVQRNALSRGFVRRSAALSAVFLCLCLLCAACSKDGGGAQAVERYVCDMDFTRAEANFTYTVRMTGAETDTDGHANVSSVLQGVCAVTRDGASYEAAFTSLQVHVTAGDAVLDFNSDNTYSGEAAVRVLPFRCLTDTPFTFSLNAVGQAGAVSGYSDVLSQLDREAYPYGSTVTTQARNLLAECVSQETVRYIFENIVGSLPPASALVPGDRWDRSYSGIAPYNESLAEQVVYNGPVNGEHTFSLSGSSGDAEATAQDVPENLIPTDGTPYYRISGTSTGSFSQPRTKGTLLRQGNMTVQEKGFCYQTVNGETVRLEVNISRQLTFTLTVANS